MSKARRGFSLIEMVVAMLIGGVLTSMVVNSYSSARGRLAVTGARTTFATLHARARAQAIEQGQNVRLLLSESGDSVTLVTEGGTRLETVRFSTEFNVDIRAGGDYRLCMNPRGFAEESCNNFNNPVTVAFWQGTDSAAVRILPLGQLEF
ncbi:MAG: type II secretion system protein [Longimicrobiales bacterium]